MDFLFSIFVTVFGVTVYLVARLLATLRALTPFAIGNQIAKIEVHLYIISSICGGGFDDAVGEDVTRETNIFVPHLLYAATKLPINSIRQIHALILLAAHYNHDGRVIDILKTYATTQNNEKFNQFLKRTFNLNV
jgi:hypothetical protein